MLQELEKAKKVSITCDIWSSIIMQSHLGCELKEILNNYELVHQQYAAYILNLTIQHSLQLVSPIIKNIRDFVAKIQHSTRLSKSLKTIYKLENKPELKPNLDIETWWNITEILSTSTYSTISDVRLTIISLLRHLESFLKTYTDTNLDECV
ncbi:5868_t:CDS:2 [Cetraspora pellucida]|uniref:5868_t:CDS:1 n=1 Tax=Cetraspora pellucida TaxID=1433469 RepID=A0ACA9KNB3_9GLOM|nr:5868_t:CDS:2 [Cetraspora pellucida]